jgi:hypothetical protein
MRIASKNEDFNDDVAVVLTYLFWRIILRRVCGRHDDDSSTLLPPFSLWCRGEGVWGRSTRLLALSKFCPALFPGGSAASHAHTQAVIRIII